MKPSIFTAVKAAVTTRQAAEAYGLKVARNGMTCCPFHDDRHPSMKVDERYYCFGCHKTGDVIDFTAKLFNLSPIEAARKLAWDFHIDPATPPPAAAMKHPAEARQDEAMCIRTLVDCETTLWRWKEQYAPSSPEEPWDTRFVEACKMLETVTAMVDQLFDPDAKERQQLVEELIQKNVIPELQARMDALGGEKPDEQTEKNAA